MRPITNADIERVPNLKDYTTAIDVNGKNHANFPTPDAAILWVHKLGLTIKSLTGSFMGEIVCPG